MNQVENSKIKPALIGGAAAGVASSIPFIGCLNCACCALVIGGGFLAAHQYYKDTPPMPKPPYGDAAILGILAGLFGAVISTVLSIPMKMISGSLGLSDAAKMHEALEKLNLPPQTEQWMMTMFGSGITATGILFGLAVSLVIYSIFSMIGALIGVSVFAKKGLPPAPPAYMPPPPAAGPPYGESV